MTPLYGNTKSSSSVFSSCVQISVAGIKIVTIWPRLLNTKLRTFWCSCVSKGSYFWRRVSTTDRWSLRQARIRAVSLALSWYIPVWSGYQENLSHFPTTPGGWRRLQQQDISSPALVFPCRPPPSEGFVPPGSRCEGCQCSSWWEWKWWCWWWRWWRVWTCRGAISALSMKQHVFSNKVGLRAK